MTMFYLEKKFVAATKDSCVRSGAWLTDSHSGMNHTLLLRFSPVLGEILNPFQQHGRKTISLNLRVLK